MTFRLVLAVVAGAVLVGRPLTAAAQPEAFAGALAEFRTAVEGTYGDEGPHLGAALDKMAAALERWDRTRAQDVAEEPAGTPLLPLVPYGPGYAFLARGEYESAIAEFRKAAAEDPLVADPAARAGALRQAAAALRRGAVADAPAMLAGSAVLDDSAEAHRILGAAYWAGSQDAKSVEHLQAAIRRNPRDERARLALSRVLSSAGRHAEAAAVLNETLAAIPDSVQARWWLGWSYERLERFTDARQEFERVATAAIAGHGPIYGAIGRLATQAADFAGALEAFTRAVEADPRDGALRKSLASALLRVDRVDEALAHLTTALQIDPRDAGAYAGIGRIHLDAGRHDEALKALRRAIEVAPAHVETRYALATALQRAGRTKEAELEFARVEREQRQLLEERRRNMARDVRGEAARRARDGGPQ